MAQKVYLKKSSVVDKTPSANGLDFGELAINYASGTGKSFLATKKYNGTIAKFHEDAYNEATFASKGDLSLVQSDIAEIKPNYVTKAQLSAASGAAVSSAYTMAVNYVNQAVSGLSIGDYLTVASASSVFSEINSQLSEMANSAVVESKISALTKTVEDNEYVVAQAFNDLNDRVDGIDERIGDFSGEFLTVSSASSVFADMGSGIQEAKDKAQSAYTYATIISGSVYSKTQTDSAIAAAKNAGVTSAYNAAVATASAYTDSQLTTVNASVSELEGKITAVSATVTNTYWTSATTQSKIATAKAEAHASAAGSAKTYTDSALAVVSGAANTRIAGVEEGLVTTNNTIGELSAGVKSMLVNVYTYKGTVANYASLPESGKVVGYVYNVEAANGNTPAGTNYAWNGSAWDPLGGSINLSEYATTGRVSEVAEDLSGFKTWFGTASGTLATKALVSTASGNAVTAANAYTDAHISGFTSGNFLTVASATARFSTVDENISKNTDRINGVSGVVKSTYWDSATTLSKIGAASGYAYNQAVAAASSYTKTVSGNIAGAITTINADISDISTRLGSFSGDYVTKALLNTTSGKAVAAANAYTDAHISGFTSGNFLTVASATSRFNSVDENITGVSNKINGVSGTVKVTYWTSATTQSKITEAKNAGVTSAYNASTAVTKTLSGNVESRLSTINQSVTDVSNKIDGVSATVKNTYWTSATTQSKIAEAKNAGVTSAYNASTAVTKTLSGNVESRLSNINESITNVSNKIDGVSATVKNTYWTSATTQTKINDAKNAGVTSAYNASTAVTKTLSGNVESRLNTISQSLSDYVTTGTAQSISGAKTFSTAPTMSAGYNAVATSSFGDSYRTIPFASTASSTNIMYVKPDANTGLMFNPNTGKLRTGGYVINGKTADDLLTANGGTKSVNSFASSGALSSLQEEVSRIDTAVSTMSGAVAGDYATKTEASEYAAAALGNSMSYTDSKVAGLSIGNYLTVASATSRFNGIDESITTVTNKLNGVSGTVKDTYWTSATTQTKINDAKNAAVTSAFTAASAVVKTLSGNVESRLSTLGQSITSVDNKVTGLSAGVISVLSTVYTYKGSVNNYSDLPSTGQVAGYVYNVINANGNTPAGTNYAWNGTAWDALGGSIDLSVYATSAVVKNQITSLDESITAASNKIDAVSATVTNNFATVANASSYAAAALSNAMDYTDSKVAGLSIGSYLTVASATSKFGTIDQSLTTNTNNINAVSATVKNTYWTSATTQSKITEAKNAAVTSAYTSASGLMKTLSGNVESRLSTLNQSITTVSNNLAGASATVRTGYWTSATTQSKITEAKNAAVTSAFTAASAVVKTLSGNVESRIAVFSQSITNLSANTVSAINDVYKVITDNEEVTAAALNELNDDLDNLSSAFETLNGSVTSISNTVNSVTGTVGTLSEDVSTLKTSASTLNDKIARLTVNSGSLQDQITRLNTNSGSLQNQITRLNANSGSLQNQITRLNANSGSLQNQVTRLNTNSGAMNTLLTLINGRYVSAATYSTADTTTSIANNTLKIPKPRALTLKQNAISIGSYDGSEAKTYTFSDSAVVQSNSTATTFRPIILGATSNATPANLTATTTGQVYVNKGIYAQPSTAKIFAAGFQLTGGGTSLLTANGSSVAQSTFVATTRKVNGHALSADVTVTLTDLGIGNVENTKLSTWTGNTSIKSVGTITAGTWNGTNIALNKLASSAITIDGTATALGGSITTKNVMQTNNTGAQYRPLLLGNNNHTTAGSIPTTTATAGTVFNIGIYAQPSTKKLFAAGFQLTAGTANILLGDGSSEARSNFATSSITHNEIVAAVANAAQKINVTADAATKHYLLGMAATGEMNSASTHLSSTGVYWENSNLYATSDERLKNFTGDVEVDFDKLKSIPKKYFKWKSEGPQGKTDIGTSAQKVLSLYPELVSGSEDSYYGVAYDKLSILALAAIDKLHEENEELRNEIKELKERLINLEK